VSCASFAPYSMIRIRRMNQVLTPTVIASTTSEMAAA
jgi:hypothetical protein